MNIHLSIIALQVAGGAIAAIIIGGLAAMLMIGDDCFLPIPFTHDKKYGGCKTFTPPEGLLIVLAFLFPIGVVTLIIALGMQIAAWINVQ
jgi:hypothetical protein